MSEGHSPESMVDLDTSFPIWERVFTVAPLVVIGTREGEGYDLAPKHMAMPIGWENHFAFACTPEHATYHNAKEHGAFTVSFPDPDQVVIRHAPLLAYLPPGRWAEVGESHNFPFPADFKR